MAYLVNVKIGRHYAYVVHFLSETILYIAEDWNFYKLIMKALIVI